MYVVMFQLHHPFQFSLASPKKAIRIPTPVVPPPTFYDKPKVDTKGSSEVRPDFPTSNINHSRNQQHCEICHKKNRGEAMLLCDGCDCGTYIHMWCFRKQSHSSFSIGFHTFCLRPPLTSIPKDHWFCYTCLSGTGGDFGFEEGEEHSLSSFQARDKEFRRRWWKDHVPERTEPCQPNDPRVTLIGGVPVHEYDVEKEFWRLVQSANETVEVEYGADVHSTTHGRYPMSRSSRSACCSLVLQRHANYGDASPKSILQRSLEPEQYTHSQGLAPPLHQVRYFWDDRPLDLRRHGIFHILLAQ